MGDGEVLLVGNAGGSAEQQNFIAQHDGLYALGVGDDHVLLVIDYLWPPAVR
jgi:hypothetical protein